MAVKPMYLSRLLELTTASEYDELLVGAIDWEPDGNQDDDDFFT